MRFVLFYHSLYSDWNHGNAHFLRGIVGELMSRGHDVRVYEPRNAWSVRNMLRDGGRKTVRAFRQAYPGLRARRYDPQRFDPCAAAKDADVVIVHEWNPPELVARLGEHRRDGASHLLLFHDTHHRMATAPEQMAAYDLSGYDGVLAFGSVIRDRYLLRGCTDHAYTWHEAADTRVFHPIEGVERVADLVWIGNWGDDERSEELREFLIEPVRKLGLTANVYGVRYPAEARRELASAGIAYRGWLPNFLAPQVFAQHRVTVHVPRRPYATQLPGIPTIRVFEALACGIPLVSAPWQDAEGLFAPGYDYFLAQNGNEMTSRLREVVEQGRIAARLSQRGLETIHRRHTCVHRVDQLLDLCEKLRATVRCRSTPAATDAAERSSPPEAQGEDAVGAVGTDAAPRPNGNGKPHARRGGLDIAFFGSSLVSAYWNGAATYYRGILRALHERGHRITFYEPDAFDRQAHRDIAAPPYARSVVYPAGDETGVRAALRAARKADLIVKASGVGVFDELLEEAVLDMQGPAVSVVYWDVDAPATLERLDANPADPLRALIPRFDYIFTYGGGDPVIQAFKRLGAKRCVPIYNALDPETHHVVQPDPRFEGTLGFLGNRLPDREQRVRDFFFDAARRLPDEPFLLGGNGWNGDAAECDNVRYLGHVYTRDHNAFNCTPRAVLNISRESMARFGFSPATRVFEAAGAGACLITDEWKGVGQFLEPGEECLVARNGEEVAHHLAELTPQRARRIGEAARRRVLGEHTYARRAETFERSLLNR